MEYDIVLSVQAQTHFREIINYLIYELQKSVPPALLVVCYNPSGVFCVSA